MSSKQKVRRPRRRAERAGSGSGANRRWWKVGGIGVVVLVVVFVAFALSRSPQASTGTGAQASTETGAQASTGTAPQASTGPSAAADVVLQDFDGNPVTISSLEGRPLVINFWASWCPACFSEMPSLEKVYQTHRDSVQFLGINLGKDIEAALSVVEQTGVTYPLARDPQGETFAAFGGYGMPTTVFLDRDGRVIELYTGELTVDELETRIVKYFES